MARDTMRVRRSARPRFPRLRLVLASAVLAGSAALAGCVPDATPEPTAEPAPSASASASPSPVPEAPELVAGGSAEDNLAYFDAVNESLLAGAPTPGGRPIVDNLVAAGFDRAAMQVTPDTTAIGGEVDSVQFSVRVGDQCLLGQSSDSGYVGTVGPAVGDSCLLGVTRTIDW